MEMIAHFTPHEQPGTLTIFATGLFLGAWFGGGRSPIYWARRRMRRR